MPFILIILGIILFVTAINGTTGKFASQLSDDVFGTAGSRGFFYWFVAIMIVGAVGYIKPLKPLSDGFIVLLILVLILADKGGIFAKFNDALKVIAQTSSQSATQRQGSVSIDIGPITTPSANQPQSSTMFPGALQLPQSPTYF